LRGFGVVEQLSTPSMSRKITFMRQKTASELFGSSQMRE
jgi:hypothetical protein